MRSPLLDLTPIVSATVCHQRNDVERYNRRIRTDVQDACSVSNAAGVHGHIDNLLLHLRGLAPITIVQQKSAPSTAFFSAPVPLLAMPGLAMANDVGPVTVKTVQGLKNHNATRSR